MPPPLLIMLITCVAIMMASPFLIGILLLLVPGRKGKLRREGQLSHDGVSAEQAKSLYAARLLHDGFEIDGTTDPLRLKAFRRGSPITQTHTHGDKAVFVEINFTHDQRGVRMRFAAWMKDFVIYDTGEGRLLDLTLDRLLNADLDRDPPPIVPTHSFMAISSLATALLSIATMAFLMLKSTSTDINRAGVVAGTALGCLAAIFLAREAMKQIRLRPEELLGKGTVVATILVGIFGMAGGVTALYLRFGETLTHAAKQYVK